MKRGWKDEDVDKRGEAHSLMNLSMKRGWKVLLNLHHTELSEPRRPVNEKRMESVQHNVESGVVLYVPLSMKRGWKVSNYVVSFACFIYFCQ